MLRRDKKNLKVLWKNRASWTLAASLMLSETNFLLNIAAALQFQKVYYFPLSLCLATTIYIIIVALIFLLGKSARHGEILELLQRLSLPITSFLVILSSKKNDGWIFGTCLGCFILQIIILCIKIVYFNGVISNASRISVVSKIVRIGKICLITFLGIIQFTQIYLAIILAGFHIMASILFSIKFTFEKIGDEYILLLGMTSGIVSCIQFLIGSILGISYLYIGEIFLVMVNLIPSDILKALIEMKYLFVISRVGNETSPMDYYISFLFISQCLFDRKKSFQLSERAKNKGLDCFLSMLQVPSLNIHENIHNQNQKILLKDLFSKCKNNKSSMLLKTMMDKLKNSNNFKIVSYILRNCFQHDQVYSRKALVLYYRLWQQSKSKSSYLQRIKFQYLSQSVMMTFQNPSNSSETIKFIQFNQTLIDLNKQLGGCLKHQLKLIQGIGQNDNNFRNRIEKILLKRYRFKENIRQNIELCFNNDTYFSSHQFKFMYVIYQVVMQKKFQNLKQKIISKFLSPQTLNLQYTNEIGNILILSGFSYGQIVNSNQSFKKQFGHASSLNKVNIVEFIPFQSIKKKHRKLMMDSIDNLTMGSNKHENYQCYLSFDDTEFGVKVKRIDRFQIKTRIFHEEREGFNFVCTIERMEQRENSKLLISSKDYNQLQSKNAPIVYANPIYITQIEEKLELYQIQLCFPTFLNKNQENYIQSTTKAVFSMDLASSDKLHAIQRMLESTKRQMVPPSKYNLLQILVTILVISSLAGLISSIHESTSLLISFISEQQVIVQTAQLLRSRMLLEQQLLSLIVKTNHFPTDMCKESGIPDMRKYLSDKLTNDLYNNSDQLMSLLIKPDQYGDLNKYLYAGYYSAQPFMHYIRQKISIQKQIRLLKAHLSVWYSTIQMKSLNIEYYSHVVAEMLNNLGMQSPNSTSSLFQSDQLNYSNILQDKISIYRLFSMIILAFCFLILVSLRLIDNRRILKYLKIALKLQKTYIVSRRSELRGSIDWLHKSKNTSIKKVNFVSEEVIELESSQAKKINQVPLQNVSKILRKQDQFHKQEISEKQKYQKIISEQQSNRFWVMNSTKIEIVQLIVIFCILIVLINILFFTQSSRITSIQMCNNAKQQLQILQERFINIIAYNWLKYLSFFETVDLTISEEIFYNAMKQLKQNQYRQNIMHAYTIELANQILHGNICKMLQNQLQCNRYRSGIFEQGLTMLLPFVIKQQFQNQELTKSDAQMYAFNICDKTWILFEAVVPFTIDIPTLGFKKMIELKRQNLQVIIDTTICFKFLLFSFICYFIYKRCKSEKSIREQVLSLDEVKKLYSLPDFRPFLNEVYYQ